VLDKADFAKLVKNGTCRLFFSKRVELLRVVMRLAKVEGVFMNMVGAVEVWIWGRLR
jgi:hypothetical protein